ncbi:MaoC/PaaZ C-terminal domain-containing protein [Streptomyces sp. NPDC091272]|uniref:MaoC/PaaZ C-terminal domain-containing protein n=1 Tax=Streptomyces sp. NPDC091272 TaxID=3365981 RepID=UPI0037F95064
MVLHILAGAARSPFKRTPGAGAPLSAPPLVRKGVQLGSQKLAPYARICGFDRAAPVPLPYPHLLGFPLAMRIMAARDFPLPLLGLVHTGIEITQRRALSPAEKVDVTVYADGLREHRRGTEVEMVTEVRAHDDVPGGAAEPVWESRSTYLARTASRTRADPPKGTPDAPAPTARWDLPGDLGRRYGRVSGDLNPIHLSPLTARPFGFRRPIAHGMWTFARCVAEVEPAEAAHVRADFRAPVLLPARVSYAATGDGGFELRGTDGRLHLRGSATALLG